MSSHLYSVQASRFADRLNISLRVSMAATAVCLISQRKNVTVADMKKYFKLVNRKDSYAVLQLRV